MTGIIPTKKICNGCKHLICKDCDRIKICLTCKEKIKSIKGDMDGIN